MAGLKMWHPDISFGGYKVTPEEIDRYEQYVIGFPSVSSTWFGTRTSGTADVKTVVIINAIADFPRNAEFAIAGSSVGMAGTLALYGKNQFGVVINESLGFGSADNGGTAVGTKVFAQISAGTITFGTFAGANGTARLGVGTAGTTSLFGLPDKIRGTTDVLAITRSATSGALAVNGGTIAAFVDSPMHAIKAPADLTGSTIISVLYRSNYDASKELPMATLTQRT